MQSVMNVVTKEHSSDELCDMETFKAMIRDLDESWSADTLKETKMAARNKGGHLGGTGRVEVAEVYSLHRMTKMARQLRVEGDQLTLEGEIDALSWAAYGQNALSLPFGGGGGAKQQWIENEQPSNIFGIK